MLWRVWHCRFQEGGVVARRRRRWRATPIRQSGEPHVSSSRVSQVGHRTARAAHVPVPAGAPGRRRRRRCRRGRSVRGVHAAGRRAPGRHELRRSARQPPAAGRIAATC